ncbi:cytoplasmic protein, partial [Salmonella enterica subsp. enterica serovar Newport]|nr:cytoplasmic protein [Salmonella enterica subsp. enterica serovar Newport]
MKNNIRFDLSDYLIHFFRDVNLETGSHIYLPEHCGFNNQHHACFIDAKYLLRLSLRSHKIFSSWSYRNGQRTVYGDSPVVCFTDMPIAAYLETGVRRL